jgi:MFS family permease
VNLEVLRDKVWYRVRAKVKNLRAAPTMPPTYLVMQAALKHVQDLYEGMSQGQRRGVPGVLNGVALVAFLDTFAMLPVLAPYAHRLGASEAEAGFLLGAYSLANLLASAGSGMLLDRLGRRLPMALSLIVAAALIALYGVVSSPEMLLLVRSLHGASSAVFIPAMFVLIGEHGHANRVWAMGRTGAIIGLVALIAPPLGGMVADRYGERALFMGIALLMGFTGMIAWLGLPAESYRPPRGESIHPLQVLRLPTLWSNFVLTFGLTFGMGMLTYRLPVMLQQAGYDAAYRGATVRLVCLDGNRRDAGGAPSCRAGWRTGAGNAGSGVDCGGVCHAGGMEPSVRGLERGAAVWCGVRSRLPRCASADL